MAPYIAEHLGTRSRRSALIPSDVALSPEEEAMIADRIGHRPVPPPDAIESTWFATVAAPNSAPKPPKSRRRANWHDAAGESYSGSTALSSECASAEGTGRPQRMAHNRKACESNCPGCPYGAASQQHQQRAEPTTKPGCQYRQLSWKIDIPHMSEVQSLGNKVRPPGSSSTQYPRLRTLAVRNAVLPPNIDHDRFSSGNLSPKGSTTFGT